MVSKNTSTNYIVILLKEFNERFSGQKTRAALEDSLKFGTAIAQENTPIKTGKLKGSEGYRILSDFKGEMFAETEYASVVNDGSSGRPPQPFFDRGVASAEQKLQETCSKL